MTGTVGGTNGGGFSFRSGNETLRVTLNTGKLPDGLRNGDQVQLYGIQTGNTFLATNVRVLQKR